MRRRGIRAREKRRIVTEINAPVPGWTEESRNGRSRRRIIVTATAEHASAELEDDVHRFGVAIDHDGHIVTALSSHGERHPWTVCAGAGAPLEALVGAPISRDVPALAEWGDAGQNCTHRFDLLAMAIAQAARGPGERRYDVEAGPDPDDGARHLVTVWRDDVEVLRWAIDGTTIHSTDVADGQDVRRILRWARETLDADMVEAIFMLRRGLLVSTFRRVDPSKISSAMVAMEMMAGACYAYQPGRAEQGLPMPDIFRDFDRLPDRLLEELKR